MVPVAIAVGVVAAGVLAVWMLLSSTGDEPPPGTAASVTGDATPSSTPSKTNTASPTTEPTTQPSKEPTKSGTPKPTKTGGQPSSKPVPDVGVYVFNQTTSTGLAARFGAELSAAGWQVLGVDNWIGHVPANTVYYWPGDQAAANRLSRDFPEVGRVWPASSPMPRDGLVVIFAVAPNK